MSQIEPIHLPDATTHPQEYREALLTVIGDQDPVAVLERTPARLRQLLAGRDADELSSPPAPGEWSAAQIVGHLLDVDVVYGFRIRLALTADRPSFPGYDEKLWSELPKPGCEELSRAFESLRTANVWLLRALGKAEWARVAVHEEQGPESVEVMVRKVAGHDLAHLNQLERALTGA
jgi:hypothetical protein